MQMGIAFALIRQATRISPASMPDAKACVVDKLVVHVAATKLMRFAVLLIACVRVRGGSPGEVAGEPGRVTCA